MLEQHWLRIPSDQNDQFRYIVTTDNGEALDTAEIFLPVQNENPWHELAHDIRMSIDLLGDSEVHDSTVKEFLHLLLNKVDEQA